MKEQIMITLSVDELRQIIREEVEKVFQQLPADKSNLPVLLTREEFMELMHCSSTTATKYFNMPGFPFLQRRGKILIETEELLKWIRKNQLS